MEELFIKLKGHRLYFNGVVEADDPEKTCDLLLLGLKPNQVTTNRMTDDIELHNSLIDSEDEKIKLSKQNEEVSTSFLPETYNIPTEYLNLNLREYVHQKLANAELGLQDFIIAEARVERELEEISKRDIENLFKTVIYVVDIFKEKSIVWGVGRGSSCACYILFLIDLNLVNPLKYNIPVEEFFH